MANTEKQNFEGILLRLVQTGLVAKGASISAPISDDAYRKGTMQWTSKDITVAVDFNMEFADFSFELVNPTDAKFVGNPNDNEVLSVTQNAKIILPLSIMDALNAHADSKIFRAPIDHLLVQCTFDMLDCFGTMRTLVPAEINTIKLIGLDAFRLKDAFPVLVKRMSVANGLMSELIMKCGRWRLQDLDRKVLEDAQALLRHALDFGDPAMENHIFMYQLDANLDRLKCAAERFSFGSVG